MSLLGRFFEQRTLTTQAIFSRDLDLLPSRNESGIAITQRNALNDAAIWAAVTLLASDISGLPVHAIRSSPDARERLPDPRWINQPDPYDPNATWVDHVETAMLSGLLNGSIFTYAEPSVSAAERLEVLNPTSVKVRRLGRERVYEFTASGGRNEANAENIVQVDFFRRPGELRGISPIDEHAEAIGLSRAAEKYSARFFGSGATMAGIISMPPGVAVTDEDRKKMRAEFDKTHGGWRKSYALGILEGGASWIETSAKPKDSQLVELRAYQVEEMARLYGIPPHMVGSQQPGAVAYASVEQRSIDYVTHCLLNRYLRKLEAGYSRLVRGDGRLSVPGSNTGVEFKVSGLLRGDAQARAGYYKSLWEVGALSADDIRRLEDQPPLPDGRGENYFYPVNYAPLPKPGAEPLPANVVPLAAAGTAA